MAFCISHILTECQIHAGLLLGTKNKVLNKTSTSCELMVQNLSQCEKIQHVDTKMSGKASFWKKAWSGAEVGNL